MNTQNLKELVYLRALVQHIPNASFGDSLEKITDSEEAYVQKVLEIADSYICTRHGNVVNVAKPIASIFERLKQKETQAQYFHRPIEFTLDRGYFPTAETDYEIGINSLWSKFNETFFKELGTSKNQICLSKTVLALLFKYASGIRAPFDTHTEVSWYDYARMKAGLAVCVHEFLNDQKRTDHPLISDDEAPILIIRADLSGIQNYIYDIASKQASKNLKGRSFYIQLLSDTVLLKILETFGLFDGNVMYASGGNFFLIVPNTSLIKKEFVKLEQDIAEAIFSVHQARLSVVLGKCEVSQKTILDGRIKEAIQLLFTQEIDRNKKRKLSSLEGFYQKLFSPIDVGGEVDTDAITGEEILDKKNCYFLSEDSSLPIRFTKAIDQEIPPLLTELTARQIRLGQLLRKRVRYVAVGRSSSMIHLDNEKLITPCNLGYSFYLIEEKEEKTVLQSLSNEGGISLYSINDLAEQNHFAVLLYGGNKAPVLRTAPKDDKEKREIEDVKYFHELSGEGKFKRLGVLRMDVDGLGRIFKDNISVPASFAFYAALSRNLDWFFKGYLNTLWENKEAYREYTQIIYSGGDDLFLIGRWDIIIQFAQEIKTEFAEFTCTQHLSEEFRTTLSGGVAIVTDKYPIIKAAAFADEAEKAAKKHCLPGFFEKNSINVLGKSLHWETEFLLVKELKDSLVKYVGGNNEPGWKIPKLPKSLLRKIQEHAFMAEEYMLAKTHNPSWVWNIAYDFSRLADRVKGEIQSKVFLKQVRDHIQDSIPSFMNGRKEWIEKVKKAIFLNQWEGQEYTSSYHFIELLGVAARWAELEIRTSESIGSLHNEN